MIGTTILCIDDHRFGLEIRKLVLEAHGFNVLTAFSGQAGLTMLDMFSVDAVLLDYKMEDMNGDEVATQIRRKHPRLPIVLLSGYPAEMPERLLRMVDAFLVKGQPLQALFSTLERVTGVLPEEKPVTDLETALDESERLVKLGRKLVAKTKQELGARKMAG